MRGVIVPKRICTRMLMGRVRIIQFCFGTMIPAFLQSHERSGATRNIPRNEAIKSKMA